MKQNKNSFSILLACLSAIAAMSGCNWENEKYDMYYNKTTHQVFLCPTFCDTTGIDDLEEKCERVKGRFWNNTCLVKNEEECLALRGGIQTSCKNYSNMDDCPYVSRTGIMLGNNIYMYKITDSTTFNDDEIYCGTYEEISNNSQMPCYQYFEKNSQKLSELNYPDSYHLFVNSSQSGVCPANTISCSKLTVSIDSQKNTTLGFCSSCEYNKIYCTQGTPGCYDLNTSHDHCGSCDTDCTKLNQICVSGQCKSPTCPLGMHYGDKGCVVDTTDACGTNGNCITDGVKDAYCTYKLWTNVSSEYCSKNKADKIAQCLKGKDTPDDLSDQNLFKDCFNECLQDFTGGEAVCAISSCANDYTLIDGKCIPSTLENCGTIGYSCAANTIGWEDGTCAIYVCDDNNSCQWCSEYDFKNKTCQVFDTESTITSKTVKCNASDCVTGYDLVDGKCEAKTSCTDPNTHYYNGECIDNDLGNCGNHAYACATNVTGWKTGECIEGKCVASECVTGYDLVDGKCEAKTSCTDPNTHYYNGECIDNDLGNCGAHGYACAINMTGWKEGECVTGECVASECVTGYDVVLGRCEAKTSCEDPDTHYYNGECIDNDLSNCGKHNNRCADITGWKDGKCDKGVCDPDDCVVGYHLDAEGKACVADDTDNCGSVGRKCGGGQVCTAGDCKDNCGSGEVRCETGGIVSCADPKTSMTYCGANATCSSYDTCTDGKVCIDGKCKQTSCSGDTTLCVVGKENQCINLTTNNANHCGACNLKCSDQKVSHATSNACSSGKCQYTCDTNYKNCGSAEVPNCIAEANLQTDPNNCGNCGVKCNADEYCSAGGCKKSTCDSNQCLTEGTCANSDTRCGTQCIDCNTANNAKSGTCSDSGECEIRECMAGYHLASDNKTCVPNTRTACAPVNSSTTTDCTNSNHAEDGYCSADGACYYTLCATGYHADNGTCVEDSDTACGAAKVNCKALDGWADGKCNGGRCEASNCKENYCLSGTTCVDGSYNSRACGVDGGACGTCGTDEACSNGECVQSSCGENVCFYMGASCQNDATHCGSTCTDCNTANNAASGTCTASGDCEITTCAAGYHRVTNASGKYACVLNTSNACGAVDATEAPIDCNNANNAASGVCNSDGSCTILSCTTGFHLDNTLRCVEDDENACGAHAIDCEAQDGWATANCDGGTCKPLTCDSGYHTTTDNKCVPDSPTACGSETNTCYSQGVALAFCNNGNCYIASCNDGYLVNNNESCELSCGGSICTTASIENSTAVECTENVCVVSACATDYHISSDNRTCELNTAEACGSPTNTCSGKYNTCENATCCQNNSTTTTITSEDCCSGLSCWKKSSNYRCATSKPGGGGWTSC